ncbi:NAD(P)H-dependent oxidoreductase [Abyssalbus ytuae]|uniref:NAD(P)H-dependent oxidoreductase n=1 Tax=Abyssalbus ytuae TaxID=2926907 RepID=A0A9E7D3K5_9FLAO|nr:NAD(P)H-dependent oxidoreductase [Abyssalbus ytuae]UOB17949.1 NAD(P)H-dependent oxidoreductase [Abyssalbus ytuae]
MKHLIIYAHPNPESLNGYFKEVVKNHLLSIGHEVEIRDLYQLGFNPVLSLQDIVGQTKGQVDDEVKQEQGFISWAENIIIIHPIWWTGLPGIMKGYIDRVFSYGFAYRYDKGIQKGLLNGKQVVVINTHGKTHTEYETMGMSNALRLTSDTGIYTYCGLKMKNHFFFDSADRATPEIIEKWTIEIKNGI